jgi:hypothetical protein
MAFALGPDRSARPDISRKDSRPNGMSVAISTSAGDSPHPPQAHRRTGRRSPHGGLSGSTRGNTPRPSSRSRRPQQRATSARPDATDPGSNARGGVRLPAPRTRRLPRGPAGPAGVRPIGGQGGVGESGVPPRPLCPYRAAVPPTGHDAGRTRLRIRGQIAQRQGPPPRLGAYVWREGEHAGQAEEHC